MKNYNVASEVTISEERGAISGNQWLPEMPTGKTESELPDFIYGKNKSGYWSSCRPVSTDKGVNLSQDEATEW